MLNALQSSSRSHWLTGLALAVLSGTTVTVVIESASDEPYSHFASRDALIQIGLAAQLMLLWLQLGVYLTVRIVRRQSSLVWIAALAWVLICEFYLWHSVHGYIGDIERFAAR